MPKSPKKKQVSRRFPKLSGNVVGLFILFICLVGIVFGLQLVKQRADNRSDASSGSGVRTGWLGLAVDWDMLEAKPNEIKTQVAQYGTPWVYDWKSNTPLYTTFGTQATPMVWGCDGTQSKVTAAMNEAINWPDKNSYIMFLNEPDDAHNLCSPHAAAIYLRQLLFNPNRKASQKIILAGGVNGPTWLKQTLQEYRNLYKQNPDIAGIHIHIYVWQPAGVAMKSATANQFIQSGVAQLNAWQQFRTKDEAWLSSKEFWISETGVLTADVSDSTMASFMTQWLNYLATQNYVTRAFWFVNNVQQVRPFSWQFRSPALYRNMIASPTLVNAYKQACGKFCPKLNTSVTSAQTTPVTASSPDLLLSVVSKRRSDGKFKTRLITTLSKPDGSLGGRLDFAKIYSKNGPGRTAVHECYFNSWDDYTLITATSTTRPSSFCPNTTAGWKETYMGVIGYVDVARTANTTRVLQGCFDSTNLNHYFVTSTTGCQAYANTLSPVPSVKTEWNYGWIQ